MPCPQIQACLLRNNRTDHTSSALTSCQQPLGLVSKVSEQVSVPYFKLEYTQKRGAWGKLRHLGASMSRKVWLSWGLSA